MHYVGLSGIDASLLHVWALYFCIHSSFCSLRIIGAIISRPMESSKTVLLITQFLCLTIPIRFHSLPHTGLNKHQSTYFSINLPALTAQNSEISVTLHSGIVRHLYLARLELNLILDTWYHSSEASSMLWVADILVAVNVCLVYSLQLAISFIPGALS